jgi:hypothetical protein
VQDDEDVAHHTDCDTHARHPRGRAGACVESAPAQLRYSVAPDGNEARYRVREQLMHHDLPNDAVGKTSAITGDHDYAEWHGGYGRVENHD